MDLKIAPTVAITHKLEVYGHLHAVQEAALPHMLHMLATGFLNSAALSPVHSTGRLNSMLLEWAGLSIGCIICNNSTHHAMPPTAALVTASIYAMSRWRQPGLGA
jgi:hypothetical protein